MRISLFLLALSMLGMPALAQSLPDFQALGGRCPNAAQLASVSARQEAGSGRYLGYSFVLRQGIPVRAIAEPAAQEISPQVQPEVFTRVSILGQANVGTPAHSLLIGWGHRELQPTVCGWVRRQDLLRVPENVQLDPVNPRHLRFGPRPLIVGELPSQRDRYSTVLARAVLNNGLIEGSVVYSFRDPNRAPTMTALTADPAVFYRRLQTFEIYSVFAEAMGAPRQATTQSGQPGLAERRYFLIGRYPGQAGGQSELFGWVHYDDLYLWNTRTAVHWTPAGGAQVFLSLGGDGRVTGAPFWTSPRQTDGMEAGGLRRLPVISSEPDSRTVQRLADRLQGDQRDNRLALSSLLNAYQVAMPYQSCSPSGECTSAEARDAETNATAGRRAEFNNVDIIILIDRSRSMGPYFRSTAEAIREFVRDLRLSQTVFGESTLRLGVMAYSDYQTPIANWEDKALDYVTVVPFHRVDEAQSERLMRRLDQSSAQVEQQDPNGDFLEAPFAALIRTAREVPWRREARTRVIIHLADHGNREAGQPSPERPSGVRERYSEADVIAALGPQSGQNGITYVPIMVEGAGSDSERDPKRRQHAIAAREAFSTQARSIGRARGGAITSDDPLISSLPANPRLQETPDQRRLAVLQALTLAQRRSVQVLETLDLMERCPDRPDSPECRQYRQDRANNIPRIVADNRALGEAGFTQEAIDRDRSRVQTVRAVWIPPVQSVTGQRREVLSYWVALDLEALRRMNSAMSELCELFSGRQRDARTTFLQSLRQIVSAQVTDPDGVPESEAIGTLLSIPFWERQAILSLPMVHFSDTLITAQGNDAGAANARAQVLLYRRSFCTSRELLNEVNRGRRLTVPVQQLRLNSEFGIRDQPNQWTDYRWDSVTGSSERVYYIPYEYFPMVDPPPAP